MSLDESVLDDIERVIGVANDAESQRIGTAMIPLEQRAERISIALASREDQVVVIESARRARSRWRDLRWMGVCPSIRLG